MLIDIGEDIIGLSPLWCPTFGFVLQPVFHSWVGGG